MINTVVIPAAGLGTRLLTATKETPKEMMPLFMRENDERVIKPLIEIIFLQLFEAGIRNFYIVVGKTKRAIEDHFTSETSYLRALNEKKYKNFQKIINDFYDKIEKSHIVWINQNSPKGFGAAVLNTKEVVGDNPFLVHAGDAFIRGNADHISQLIRTHDKYKPDITLYLRNITNPKAYGVAEAKKMNKSVFKVSRVEEKPKQPKSNFALMPLYAFESNIFDALQTVRPSYRNEIELTDGIQKIIEQNNNVNAIKFNKADDCIDIGTPENFFRALKVSFHDSKR